MWRDVDAFSMVLVSRQVGSYHDNETFPETDISCKLTDYASRA